MHDYLPSYPSSALAAQAFGLCVKKRHCVVVVYDCFNDQQRVGLDLTYFSICFHFVNI